MPCQPSPSTLPNLPIPAERKAARLRHAGIALMLCTGLTSTLAEPADIPSGADACLKDQTETTPSDQFKTGAEDSIIVHQATTLEWQRCALGQTWQDGGCSGRPQSFTWRQAQRLDTARQDGWRLPSAVELQTIVERCHPAPAINPQVFPNTPGKIFWTSSRDTGGLERIWAISFFAGSRYRVDEDQECMIRLVRGNMPAPP